MAIPDKWKQPPIQAKKDEKKLTQEELVAKLLNTGLARSSMEAKQMAASMMSIEKTQKQFEDEIKKAANAPRRPKANGQINGADDLVSSVSDAVDGDTGSSVAIDGLSKAQALLVKDVAALREHVARQQQIIERLEADMAFVRSQLQQSKEGETPKYPRTPTAAELLEAKDEKPPQAEPDAPAGEDDFFITPGK